MGPFARAGLPLLLWSLMALSASGLLYLLGANGLPQLLAQRGYLVERVY